MGKGDNKTKRGKIIIGSFGVRRSRKKKKANRSLPALKKNYDLKKTTEIVEAINIEPVQEKIPEQITITEDVGVIAKPIPEKTDKPVAKEAALKDTPKKTTKPRVTAKKEAESPKGTDKAKDKPRLDKEPE